MSTHPGSVGPYRILDTIGVGGMGVVYRGENPATGQLAAIKTVRVPMRAQLSGLRREIHALARLSHPGIVRVIDEGLHHGLPWYAMELLEGDSLRDYVPGRRTTADGADRATNPTGDPARGVAPETSARVSPEHA